MSNKPKPPSDLWERLDAEYSHRTRPENSFTIGEYAKRYGITHSAAEVAIDRLEVAGVIECVGRYGSRNARHYTMKAK